MMVIPYITSGSGSGKVGGSGGEDMISFLFLLHKIHKIIPG